MDRNLEIKEFMSAYYEPRSPFLENLREEGEKNQVPIILRDTEVFFNTFMQILKPSKILEVGTAIGYSSIYFATVCEDAEIYTVEKNSKMADIAEKNIRDAGLENRIHVLRGDGEDAINKLCEEEINGFDFVFIDAAKSHYLRFLESALKVSSRDVKILCDNIWMHGMTFDEFCQIHKKHKTNIRKMREFVDVIEKSEILETSLLNIGDGLSLSIIKEKND